MEDRNSTSTPEKKDANALDESSTQESMGTRTGATSSTRFTAGYTTRMSSKSRLELHQRCAETIERCSAKLRERQRKMDRLQLLLPIPKAGNSKEDRRRVTPQPRFTPPRPAKRNKPDSGIFDKNFRSPAWSKSSSSQHFNHMTPPRTNRNSNEQAKMTSSLGTTPNSDKSATQEVTPTTSRSEDTLDLTLTDKFTDSPQKKVTVLSPTWAQRQQDFIAAIEAADDSNTSPS